MRLCVVANIESIHVKKMLRYIVAKGHQVDVIGFDRAEIEGVNIHTIKTPPFFKSRKMRYLFCIFPARKLIKKTKPDILKDYIIRVAGNFQRNNHAVNPE